MAKTDFCDICGKDTRSVTHVCADCCRDIRRHEAPDTDQSYLELHIDHYSRDDEVAQEVWDKVAELLGLE